MNDDSLPMTIQYTNFYVHMTLSLPYHNNRYIRCRLTLNGINQRINQIKRDKLEKKLNQIEIDKLDKKN